MTDNGQNNFNHKYTIDVLPTEKQVSEATLSKGVNSLEPQHGNLQQIVDSAIVEVLGRNANDPKVILTSLKQSFAPQEIQGRITYIWTPRTYAVQTETGGALSGAQASLYYRAKAALDSILPLLNGLIPLDPAADLQNMEAMRSIVRTELSELVHEIGLEGGPRIWRVDNLFVVLLGEKSEVREKCEKNISQLQNLAQIFGFKRNKINNVEEEQNYTNYLTILDYVISLRYSWDRYKDDTKSEKYLGTQLVKLSQALSAVADSVNEAYRIMDAVFLGFAERQSVIIDFDEQLPEKGEYPIRDKGIVLSLEELLSWAKEFATFEGQALAKGGGKLAIAEVVKETAKQIADVVNAASDVKINNSAFDRAGVRDSLKDLAAQLRVVEALAKQVKPETKSKLSGSQPPNPQPELISPQQD